MIKIGREKVHRWDAGRGVWQILLRLRGTSVSKCSDYCFFLFRNQLLCGVLPQRSLARTSCPGIAAL